MLLRRAACVLAAASPRHHHLVLEEARRPCSAFPGNQKTLDFLKIQYDEPIDGDHLTGKIIQ
jgi:hypothetical protein